MALPKCNDESVPKCNDEMYSYFRMGRVLRLKAKKPSTSEPKKPKTSEKPRTVIIIIRKLK